MQKRTAFVLVSLLVYGVASSWVMCWMADWVFANVSSDKILFTAPYMRFIFIHFRMLSANYYPYIITACAIIGIIGASAMLKTAGRPRVSNDGGGHQDRQVGP